MVSDGKERNRLTLLVWEMEGVWDREEGEGGRAGVGGEVRKRKVSTPYLHWRDFTPYWKRHCSSASYAWPGAVVGYTKSCFGGTLFRHEPRPELQRGRMGDREEGGQTRGGERERY